MSRAPIANRSVTLAQSVAIGLQRTRIRTYRGKEREEGKGHDPDVPGVNHVATMELEGGGVNA